MKVPDKIYIHEASAPELALPRKDYHLEYIRKDALLEWAKKQYREYVNNPFYAGERDAYTQLIKKLNSL